MIFIKTPVHTGIAHTANINTLIERPAPTPPKGKRSPIPANEHSSPTPTRRKTQNKTAKKAPAHSSKKENPTNGALSLAFEDPAAPTPLTSPLQCGDSSCDLDFDLEQRADLPGFLSASPAKAVTSLFESFFPDNDNDDDVLLPSTDVPMTEDSLKRTLRSSRSTDAKTSETPVVDDVTQPPPNSSPGEPQQQRAHKRVNKRVNKKVKREI